MQLRVKPSSPRKAHVVGAHFEIQGAARDCQVEARAPPDGRFGLVGVQRRRLCSLSQGVFPVPLADSWLHLVKSFIIINLLFREYRFESSFIQKESLNHEINKHSKEQIFGFRPFESPFNNL
jgi:hypothetical protein